MFFSGSKCGHDRRGDGQTLNHTELLIPARFEVHASVSSLLLYIVEFCRNII